MNPVLDFLLWPVALFLQAVSGALAPAKTPEKAVYRRIARLALLASTVIFMMTLPLSRIANPAIGVKPPLAVGVTLLLIFVVFGNLCDEGDDDDI